MYQVTKVYSVTGTDAPETFILDVEYVLEPEGEVYRASNYVLGPTDPHGAAPALRQWMIDNKGNYEVLAATPATEKSMLPVTKRQLRLTLVREGISLTSVEALIAAMPDGLPKEEAQIEWDDAQTFDRDHPTLLLIAQALGLSSAKVDEMWLKAIVA